MGKKIKEEVMANCWNLEEDFLGCCWKQDPGLPLADGFQARCLETIKGAAPDKLVGT